MLFESLDKIKRNSIFSAIILMALGVVMMLCPESYIDSFILGVGYVLIITAIVIMLDFFVSNKSLVDYALFVLGLIVLILGGCVLIFSDNIMIVMARIFGILLVADGVRTMFHAFAYCRRSQRKGWWILVILAVLLIFAGVGIFVNPFFHSAAGLMNGIGATLLFAAVVSTIRLIWEWPLRNVNGGDEDEKKEI